MKAIRNIFIFIATFALFVGCNKDPKNYDDYPPISPMTLKIMSFNVRSSTITADTGDKNWSVRKVAIKKMFEDTMPDIIGMQEATTAQRADLKAMLPNFILLEVPNTGGSKGGNAVMMYNTNLFELLQSKSFYLSSTPNIPSVNGWNSETQYRTTIWGEFKHKETGRVFIVANTHMPLYSTADGILARMNSANLNVERIKTVSNNDTPVFIIGDMNCNKSETGLKPYYDWMSSAQEKAMSTDNVLSFNNFGGSSNSNLDYIFYRNAIPAEYRTINGQGYGVKYISDHYPVLCKFNIL